MPKVVIAGRTLSVDPAAAIGKGGEADVFALADGRALKLFKAPDHPDLAGQPLLQHQARERLAEQQEKLRHFPAGLPASVIAPEELAFDPRTQEIAGYAMRLVPGAEVLLRLGERSWRDRHPSAAADVVRLFDALAGGVHAVHRAGVVIGDFNDLNVLVSGAGGTLAPHLIDADSMQFGRWPCRAYTERFLDPLLADRTAARPMLERAYVPDADWFAFAVMLFRSLVLVDPFGGVHRPTDATARVSPSARALRGVSVLRGDVQLPGAAHRIDMLPDDALEAFRRVFEDSERTPAMLAALRGVRWSTCASCGIEHARAACPGCRIAPPLPALPAQEVVRGQVTARRMLSLRGAGARILAATLDGGRLRWLAREGLTITREDGIEAMLPAHLRALLLDDGPATAPWVGLDGDAIVVATRDLVQRVAANGAVESWTADASRQGGATSVATAPGFVCWQEQGRLLRRGRWGPERVGDVLAGQTRVWADGRLGFGVSRAGPLALAFMFKPGAQGIMDGVALPRVRGRVVDEQAVIGHERVWHVVRESAGARIVSRCTVVDAGGHVLATREAEAGGDEDDAWLVGSRGLAAAGPWLFAVTDDGVVRVGAEDGRLGVVARYPDTAPFVADPCTLLVGSDGIHVIAAREIVRLVLVTR
jgi:hypothetical protein